MLSLLPSPLPTHLGVVLRELEAYGTAEALADFAALSARCPALLLVEIAEDGTRFWGPMMDRQLPRRRVVP